MGDPETGAGPAAAGPAGVSGEEQIGDIGGDVAVENTVAVEAPPVETEDTWEADSSADYVEAPMEMELEEQP